MVQYLALVEDLEVEFCFLSLLEIRASPRNLHHLVVDFLVFEQLAQSVSKYACSLREELKLRCHGAFLNLLMTWTNLQFDGRTTIPLEVRCKKRD